MVHCFLLTGDGYEYLSPICTKFQSYHCGVGKIWINTYFVFNWCWTFFKTPQKCWFQAFIDGCYVMDFHFGCCAFGDNEWVNKAFAAHPKLKYSSKNDDNEL